ncbi:MAG: ATP-grasp domain-containing protein [Mogibacterium sp.]|nr:ATP-grasp domain-containing protein [Mogibacterium sp.]
MKIAASAGIIGASNESIYAIEEAKKRGIYTIAVDGNEKAPGLEHANQSAVVDLNDEEALFDYFCKNPIDFLLPVPVGRILVATGAVNDRFDLPGVRFNAAHLSTDKWAFHETLSNKGLRNAEALLVKSNENVSKLADIDYPLILKPRFGSGSRAVKKYGSYAELSEDVGEIVSKEEDFIAETCKKGIEYGADVFIVNGTTHLILLREKILTPEPYRQCVGYFAIEYNRETEELFNRINTLLKGIVDALGLNNCLMHADILDDGREAFVIEVSPRPSGHYLHNYFTRYATGFDMLGSYIDFAIASKERKPFEMDYQYNAKSMLIKYFDLKEGIIEKLPDPETTKSREDVVCYNCNLKPGDSIGMVTDGRSVMGRGFYVVAADTLESAKAICAEIEKQFVIREV